MDSRNRFPAINCHIQFNTKNSSVTEICRYGSPVRVLNKINYIKKYVLNMVMNIIHMIFITMCDVVLVG